MLVKSFDKKLAKLVHENSVYAITLFSREELNSELLCGQAFLKKGMKAQPHSHPEKEIYIFSRGRGHIQIGNEMQPIKESEAVYIPPNTIHSAWNEDEEDLEYIWISFSHKPLPYLTKLISYFGRKIVNRLYMFINYKIISDDLEAPNAK